MFSTVVSITAVYPSFWIGLFTSIDSRFQVVLDQEDDPWLYDEWLTANERLTPFSKAIEKILERVKGAELPYFQVPQYF